MCNPVGNTDDQLYLQLQSGSVGAFTVIFERYRGRVFMEIFQHRQDEKEANHYTEQVFIWLWTNKKSVKDITNFSYFLTKIVLPKVYK